MLLLFLAKYLDTLLIHLKVVLLLLLQCSPFTDCSFAYIGSFYQFKKLILVSEQTTAKTWKDKNQNLGLLTKSGL